MEKSKLNQYIRSVRLDRDKIEDFNIYPFSLPILKNLTELDFNEKVAFIVGENGSGKSTLLEAIAVAYGFNPEGGTKNFNFSTRASHSDLYEYLKLVKGIRSPKNGFFLRAESMYNVASNIEEMDKQVRGNSIIDSYGGRGLHDQSHGESFMSIFMNRFASDGIYILDEPEAALSPSRQMAIISRIHDLVKEGCQFIIATHSPILMAYPHSIIYEIKGKSIENVEYERTEHYQITKEFLNNREKFLDILME